MYKFNVVFVCNLLLEEYSNHSIIFASNHTTDLGLSQLMCNCYKNCSTNNCVCKKAKQKCTSHCHSKQTSTKACENK